MWLDPANATIRKTNSGHAFQLTPSPRPIRILEKRPHSNARPGSDKGNIFDCAQERESHGPKVRRRSANASPFYCVRNRSGARGPTLSSAPIGWWKGSSGSRPDLGQHLSPLQQCLLLLARRIPDWKAHQSDGGASIRKGGELSPSPLRSSNPPTSDLSPSTSHPCRRHAAQPGPACLPSSLRRALPS